MDGIFLRNSVFKYVNFLSVDESSNSFVTFFETWRNDFFVAIGLPVTRFYIRDINTATPYIDVWIPTPAGNARARFDCTYTITQDVIGNNIVKFVFNAASPNNQDFGLSTFFEQMTNFIFRDSGFYVQKMMPLPFQNTLGFIPVDDTAMLVHWYDF